MQPGDAEHAVVLVVMCLTIWQIETTGAFIRWRRRTCSDGETRGLARSWCSRVSLVRLAAGRGRAEVGPGSGPVRYGAGRWRLRRLRRSRCIVVLTRGDREISRISLRRARRGDGACAARRSPSIPRSFTRCICSCARCCRRSTAMPARACTPSSVRGFSLHLAESHGISRAPGARASALRRGRAAVG